MNLAITYKSGGIIRLNDVFQAGPNGVAGTLNSGGLLYVNLEHQSVESYVEVA